VLFDSGQDVDFALLPSAGAAWMSTDPGAVAVLDRGFRVLVDKDNLERALRGVAPVSPAPPDAAAFGQLTSDFWYHALWTAKKLRRGEIWIAMQCCDCHLKTLLVRLLAWHAQASHPRLDTWHGGRFLERWADRAALRELGGTFARYDAEDVARALWATVALFERLERECAVRLGLQLTVAHDQVRRHLQEVLG
jgi:aminoglycoside 6-adenylyltransferase